jgi:hypothetical protein
MFVEVYSVSSIFQRAGNISARKVKVQYVTTSFLIWNRLVNCAFLIPLQLKSRSVLNCRHCETCCGDCSPFKPTIVIAYTWQNDGRRCKQAEEGPGTNTYISILMKLFLALAQCCATVAS